jgi:hypothetical protein
MDIMKKKKCRKRKGAEMTPEGEAELEGGEETTYYQRNKVKIAAKYQRAGQGADRGEAGRLLPAEQGEEGDQREGEEEEEEEGEEGGEEGGDGQAKGAIQKEQDELEGRAAPQDQGERPNDATKLEDMRDHTARRKLALKAFADELRRGISDQQFEGLAGGSGPQAAALGRRRSAEEAC